MYGFQPSAPTLDIALYNKVLQTASVFLRNNLQSVSREMANLFMQEHDPNNGQAVATGVNNLRQWVAAAMQNSNNQMNDNQLYQTVGNYVVEFCRMVDAKMRARQGGGMSLGGGFSNNGGGYGLSQPGFGNSAFGNLGAPAYIPGSHLSESPSQQQPHQQQPTMSEVKPHMTSVPEQVYSFADPLEGMKDTTISKSSNEASPNWGVSSSVGSSIVFMSKDVFRGGDGIFAINQCRGFTRIFTDNDMDVVRTFFRDVPDPFLADYFAFQMFYNHVEKLNVPTDQFLNVRTQFINKLSGKENPSPYDIIISILDEMSYGSRKAIVEYLTKLINRTLHLYCGVEAMPGKRIEFDAIEDLQILLGPDYKSPILGVPDAKNTISNLINKTILNALTIYSDVMFYDPKSSDIDVIRTSEVFPYSIPGVYGNKQMIPQSGTEDAKDFYDRMMEFELSKVTYVRSIRSVVITNLIGPSVLSNLHEKPRQFGLKSSHILKRFIPRLNEINSYGNLCRTFDVGAKGDAMADFNQYKDIGDSEGSYETTIRTLYVDLKPPVAPVDQRVFTIQYKRNPKEYLGVVDICTTMDGNMSDDTILLSKSVVTDLKVTA